MKMAEGYDGREIITKLRTYVPDSSKILELGSGPGVDLEILSRNYNATGSDLSEEFLNVIRKKLPKVKTIILDAVSIDTEDRFDAIYSNKVLHHLNDEDLKTSIRNQTRILEGKGVICHTFWKGDKKETMHGLLFNYHTEEKIAPFFEPYFDIQVLESYKEMAKDDSILVIASKKG